MTKDQVEEQAEGSPEVKTTRKKKKKKQTSKTNEVSIQRFTFFRYKIITENNLQTFRIPLRLLKHKLRLRKLQVRKRVRNGRKFAYDLDPENREQI